MLNWLKRKDHPSVMMAVWCSGCSAEQATSEIEVQVNGQWVTIDIGPECLTRAQKDGRMNL